LGLSATEAEPHRISSTAVIRSKNLVQYFVTLVMKFLRFLGNPPIEFVIVSNAVTKQSPSIDPG